MSLEHDAAAMQPPEISVLNWRLSRGGVKTEEVQVLEDAGESSEKLDGVQRELLLNTFGCLLFVGSLLLPITLLRDLHTKHWLMGPHLVVYAMLLGVWLNRAKLSSETIAKVMVSTLYIVGTLSLLRMGIVAVSFLAYALVVIATPMMFGRRAGWMVAALCVLTYLAIGALTMRGVIQFNVDTQRYVTSLGNWLYTGAAFCSFAAVAVVIAGAMHRRIDDLLRSEVARSQMLKTSNERLAEANERLRDMNERLEDLIAERTERLQQANSELESFSYTVSHDLRSPLQVIEGFSALALQEEGVKMPEKSREYLQRIQGSARRMHDMISQLLAFSGLHSVAMQKTRVNLTQLAEALVVDLRITQPAHSVEVSIQPDLIVTADPTLMVNVLHNLLSNAWKFTARTPSPRVEVSSQHEASGAIVYVVRDNGVGFCQERASRLFQPFVRLHDKRDFAGNGVGLATARRIVERHGGRIWAESTPQQGAAFFFTLAGAGVSDGGAGSDATHDACKRIPRTVEVDAGRSRVTAQA